MEPRRLNRRGWIYCRGRAGQALLELAIFGSLFLMLLAILISYGLKYNYQQELTQSAFRNALSSAAKSMDEHEPSAVTYVTIQDKHIPDPSNPFGIGSVIPMSASASVTQSYQLQHTPDYEDELPVLKIKISGQEFGPYTTAGFNVIENIPFMPKADNDELDTVSKYEYIYGATVLACLNDDCSKVKKLPDSDESWGEIEDKYNGYIPCMYSFASSDTGVSCTGYKILKARIMDSCAGKIIDYDSAVEQCRQIIDKEVCRRTCERNKSPYRKMNCKQLCSFSMNVPEYCQTLECGTGECPDESTKIHETDPVYHPQYTFTKLDNIFAVDGAGRRMGLSQDTTNTTKLKTTLEKQVETGKVTDTIDWQNTIERTVIYYDKDTKKAKPEPVVTVFSPNEKNTEGKYEPIKREW